MHRRLEVKLWFIFRVPPPEIIPGKTHFFSKHTCTHVTRGCQWPCSEALVASACPAYFRMHLSQSAWGIKLACVHILAKYVFTHPSSNQFLVLVHISTPHLHFRCAVHPQNRTVYSRQLWPGYAHAFLFLLLFLSQGPRHGDVSAC